MISRDFMEEFLAWASKDIFKRSALCSAVSCFAGYCVARFLLNSISDLPKDEAAQRFFAMSATFWIVCLAALITLGVFAITDYWLRSRFVKGAE